MGDPRPGREGAGWIADELRAIRDQIRDLSSPSGTQRYGSVGRIEKTLDYLSSLQTFGASGAAPVTTGTVANDALNHWFASTPDTRIENLEIPTGRCRVTASVGEASIAPGGSFVVGYVTYSMRDANGVVVPGAGIGVESGRLYTSQRMGLSISTGPQFVTVDPGLNPGPYLVRAFVGMWVAAANTDPCSGTFNDLSLEVEIIGSGVEL